MLAGKLGNLKTFSDFNRISSEPPITTVSPLSTKNFEK